MDNIKFVVKGKPLDVTGHQVDGVTYGPVRALLEALGHQVGWYGPKRAVYIDTPLPQPKKPLWGCFFIVDYGHGRDNKTGVGDPGAVDSKDDDQIMTYEDDLVLLYGREFSEGLRKLGAEVVETRPEDVLVSPEERVRIANKYPDADMFISWHANAATAVSASGYEVLISGVGGQAERLARALIKSVSSAGIKLHGDGFVVNPKIMVLNSTRMPAVLQEVGFITNPAEEAKLHDPEYRRKLVAAALAGVLDWMKEKK